MWSLFVEGICPNHGAEIYDLVSFKYYKFFEMFIHDNDSDSGLFRDIG